MDNLEKHEFTVQRFMDGKHGISCTTEPLNREP